MKGATYGAESFMDQSLDHRLSAAHLGGISASSVVVASC